MKANVDIDIRARSIESLARILAQELEQGKDITDTLDLILKDTAAINNAVDSIYPVD